VYYNYIENNDCKFECHVENTKGLITIIMRIHSLNFISGNVLAGYDFRISKKRVDKG